MEASFDAQIAIKNRNVVMNSEGVPIVMGRNCELVLGDEEGRERARHRVPYGAKLLADEGARSSAVRSSPNGTRTPCRSSPSAKASRTTSIWSRACRSRGGGRDDRHHRSVVIDWRQQPRGAT